MLLGVNRDEDGMSSFVGVRKRVPARSENIFKAGCSVLPFTADALKMNELHCFHVEDLWKLVGGWEIFTSSISQ